MKKSLVIAIDGYSSCGKSTVAKDLAKKLGITYIDSGAMYRAVTIYFLRNQILIPSNLKDHDNNYYVDVLDKIDITFRINAKTGEADVYLINDF